MDVPHIKSTMSEESKQFPSFKAVTDKGNRKFFWLLKICDLKSFTSHYINRNFLLYTFVPISWFQNYVNRLYNIYREDAELGS